MESKSWLAALCQSTDRTTWQGLLEEVLREYQSDDLDAWAQQVKSPHVFDRLLSTDLACAEKVADFLIELGSLAHRDRVVALGRLAQGDVNWHRGWHEQAMRPYREAAALFAQGGDRVGEARAQSALLLMAIYAGRVQEQHLTDIEQARHVFQEHGQVYRLASLEQNIGLARYYLGHTSLALEVFERALEQCPNVTAADHELQAMLLANKANTLRWRGEIRQARELHRRARDQFAQLGSFGAAARQDFNLCAVEGTRGHYREALRAAQEASEGYLQVGEKQNAASALVSRAEILLLLNRNKEALLETARAVDILSAFEIRIDLVKALIVQARASARCAQFPEARAALARAQAVATQTGYPVLLIPSMLEHARVALMQSLAAEAQKRDAEARGQAARAQKYASEAQVLAAEAQAEALAVLNLAGIEETGLSRDVAELVAAEAALAQNLTDWAHTHARRILDKYFDQEMPDLRCRAFVLLARIAERQGDAAGTRAAYDAALAVLGTLASRLVYDQRAEFLEDKEALFQTALAAALEADDPLKALEVLEQGRAYADWAAPLHFGQPGLDPALADLLSQHRAMSDALAEAPPTKEFMQIVWRIRDHLETWANSQPLHLPTGTALVNAIPPGTTTLAYAVLERDLIIFILRAGNLTVRRVDNGAHTLKQLTRSLLHLSIESFLQEWAVLGERDPRQAAIDLERTCREPLQDLWSLLIAPVEKTFLPPEGGTLRFVPYGDMHALPLAALYDGSRYLVEVWEVQTAPTCRPQQHAPSQPLTTRSPLVIGYSPADQLPQVMEEVRRVGEVLHGEVRVGSDANSKCLFQETAARPYLHIVAHGRQRGDLPQSSFVALADGPFHPIDVFALDLRGCRLITLSACQTGLGRSSGGDAQLGLVRAFGYAGAEAVLATLWPVEDASAAIFMEGFYRHLVAGSSPSAALRQAQLAFIRHENPLYTHPYFWAGYQLITYRAWVGPM